MKHRERIITIFTVVAMGITACGSIPLATSQPVNEPALLSEPQDQPSSLEIVPATVESVEETEVLPESSSIDLTYPIVDTDQSDCYSDSTSISCPNEGDAFYGQDAQYTGNTPRYQDNGDGTVTDLLTDLMWQADPGEKMTYDQAVAGASDFNLADYTDWRLPTIKELYSLIQFDGLDPSGPNSTTLIPFIDTDYFNFEYGDESAGERVIDSQWATSSVYTGSVFGGQQAMFGVNFADGRIKGYPTGSGQGGRAKTYFVIYVRGNTSYGINEFVDNGNGTVTDFATGLIWMQYDSATGMNWESALNYCESLEFAGTTDWRLPNAKELQSIVDYNRSPDATNSAAIDPIFNVSTITNEAGQLDYPAFWSSTTHVSSNGSSGAGNYIAFGRALGYMNGQWMDVHGAGAQRSEDKDGNPSSYPTGHGPQGDAVRIYNYVRCVTGGTDGEVQAGGPADNTPVSQERLSGEQAPQGQSLQQNGLQNRQPPQEAVNACLGLSQGTACTVNTPNGTLTGSCLVVQSDQLACVPAGEPPAP